MFDITDFLLKPVLLILEEIKYNLINLSSSFSQILKSTCANREPSSLSEILFGSRFVVLLKSDTDVQHTHLRVFTNRKHSNTDQQPIQQINRRVNSSTYVVQKLTFVDQWKHKRQDLNPWVFEHSCHFATSFYHEIYSF